MKINIGFKTPDAVYYALDDHITDGEKQDIEKHLEKWIEYGECVTLIYDTVTDTIEVQRIK